MILAWQCEGTRIEVNWNEKAIYVVFLSRWRNFSKKKVFLGVPENVKKFTDWKKRKVLYSLEWDVGFSKFYIERESISQIFERLKDWGVVLSERRGREVLKELFLKLEEERLVGVVIGRPETIDFLRKFSMYLEDGKHFLQKEKAKEFSEEIFIGLRDEVNFYLHPGVFEKMEFERKEIVKALKEDGLIPGSKVIRVGKRVCRFYVLEKEKMKGILSEMSYVGRQAESCAEN